jgi:hypothetical protein
MIIPVIRNLNFTVARYFTYRSGQQQGGDFSCDCPQQESSSPPQLHSALSIPFPLSAAEIIAQAHPTPL